MSPRCRQIALAVAVAAAAPATATAMGIGPLIPLEMRGILARTLSGRCVAIVEQMTRAADRDDADAMLVLGWMHERGFCVAVDTERSFDFYSAAYRLGQVRAAERLAGLGASAQGGRDLVSTLWWARRSDRQSVLFAGTGDCDPLPGQARPTEDEFIEALKVWPQERRQRCVADVGFRAMLLADMRYSSEALEADMEGSVTVAFDLNEGRYTIHGAKGAGPELLRYVDRVALDAITRAPRAPAPAKGSVQFEFRLRY